MKITVPGRTPMERLTNLTKRVIAVPKEEIEREDQKWRKARDKTLLEKESKRRG